MNLAQYEVEKDIYLIHDDCFKFLPKIEDKNIDLIFVDPPYFCGNKKFVIKEKSYKRINETWDTFKSKADYLNFLKNTFAECFRILKDGGTILTTGTFHNAFDVHIILRDEIGFTLKEK